MFSHKNTKNTENLGLRPRPQKPFVNFVHFVAKNERLGGEVTKTRIDACGLTRRDIVKAGAGLAAVVASGKAPAMLLGARQFFMGGGKPTAKDYICDAAQVHFDGIENDGYGVHSDNRISNLVNSNQFAYAFNASYGKTTADSLCGSFYQSTSNRSMKFNCSNTGYTMEWCGKWRNCEVPFGTLFAGCLQFRNDQRVAFWYGSSSKYVFLPIPISDTQRQYVAVQQDGTTVRAYINGILAFTGSNSTTGNISQTFFYPFAQGAGRGLDRFETCAVRMHSRALSAAEVAENYAIDKARFGLT